VTSFAVVLLGAALALGVGAWPAPLVAQGTRGGDDRTPAPGGVAVIVYTAPTSGTWGPSATALPTFAFGKPAEVLLVVPGGYVVRQEAPLEQALAQAAYVSQQLGHPVAVTIPDPAGGPPRVEYVGGTHSGDPGK
jgi:hypothetical protein